jgi:flagellar biogenesis protein FliO
MRACPFPAWIVCVGLSLAPLVAAAQQAAPGSLVSPHLSPITVEEPRTFPPAAAVEARLLSPAFHASPPAESSVPSPHRIQPPVNFRLATAEEAVAQPVARPPLRLAPRSEASRPAASELTKPSITSPGNALGTVAGSLGVVLGLFLVVAWCSRRLAPAGAALLPKDVVELLGRAPLATRQQMQLVRIGNKLLLVAISPVGVQTLTEVTEPTEVEHLVALCRRGQPGTSSAAFRQALTQLASEPAERGFVGASRPTSRGA